MTDNKKLILMEMLKIDESSKYNIETLISNKLPDIFLMTILGAKPYWKHFYSKVDVILEVIQINFVSEEHLVEGLLNELEPITETSSHTEGSVNHPYFRRHYFTWDLSYWMPKNHYENLKSISTKHQRNQKTL